jgi:hypothetical protein
VAAAALGALTAVSPPPVSAATTSPSGTFCGVWSVSDPFREAGWMSGVLDFGPATGGAGSYTCTIQVGSASHSAGGVSYSFASGGGVVASPGGPVSYVAADEPVYLCSRWTSIEGSTLFWDDAASVWTASAEARCGLVPTVDLAQPAVGSVRAGLAKGHVKKDKDGGTPPAPFYPQGTITIRSTLPGALQYLYSGFSPGFLEWSCTEAGTTVSCTPPPAPPGYANVCGHLEVTALNRAAGTVHGSTRCASGTAPSATSQGPATTPASATAPSGAGFPWVCEAAPVQPVPGPWEVSCTVGP